MAMDAAASRGAGTPWYSEERWQRFAPLTGVLAVILWILGIALIESAADTPDDDAAAQAFVDYYEQAGSQLLAGAFVFMVGSALFLWFLGTLRARIHSLEGAAGRLASIVFALGIVIATMSMAMVAPEAGAGLAVEEFGAALEPAAAQTFSFAGTGSSSRARRRPQSSSWPRLSRSCVRESCPSGSDGRASCSVSRRSCR